jgi:hypothetical protein
MRCSCSVALRSGGRWRRGRRSRCAGLSSACSRRSRGKRRRPMSRRSAGGSERSAMSKARVWWSSSALLVVGSTRWPRSRPSWWRSGRMSRHRQRQRPSRRAQRNGDDSDGCAGPVRRSGGARIGRELRPARRQRHRIPLGHVRSKTRNRIGRQIGARQIHRDRRDSSNQRPDILMQDRKPADRLNPLATHGRTLLGSYPVFCTTQANLHLEQRTSNLTNRFLLNDDGQKRAPSAACIVLWRRVTCHGR